MKSVIPLTEIDIVLTIYNQEKIIEYILAQLFKNTLTPFNLIIVFDGCTDQTKPVALAYIEKNKPAHFKKLITEDAPNVFETRANNIGFKLATADYMVTLQDDMAIMEPGWEIRLTYPLRALNNVLAVTSRIAQDIDGFDGNLLRYKNKKGREFLNLSRNTFAVRDVINRGPLAFNMKHLRNLNYLNDNFAPSDLDDADLSLRAWKQHGLVVGAYWIDYYSPDSWSKAAASDSTMGASKSARKNSALIDHDHHAYLASKIKHSQNISLKASGVDYPQKFSYIKLSLHIFTSQLFFTSRILKKNIYRLYRRIVKKIKSSF